MKKNSSSHTSIHVPTSWFQALGLWFLFLDTGYCWLTAGESNGSSGFSCWVTVGRIIFGTTPFKMTNNKIPRNSSKIQGEYTKINFICTCTLDLLRHKIGEKEDTKRSIMFLRLDFGSRDWLTNWRSGLMYTIFGREPSPSISKEVSTL